MSYQIIEPCCGSASLSLYLAGATRAIVPYQGSKWRYRFALEEAVKELGFNGKPKKIILNDISPWGRVISLIFNHDYHNDIITKLKDYTKKDPFLIYNHLNKSEISEDPVEYCADFLFLQRLSFSGKAVGSYGGFWNSPGFNKTSAYGIKATDKFGEVKPMIPSLIRNLESLIQKIDTEIVGYQKNNFMIDGDLKDTIVYLDPPYVGTTLYPDGNMSREEVKSIGKQWFERGARVIISEKEPIDMGWESRKIYKGRNGFSPFKGKQEEWITYK